MSPKKAGADSKGRSGWVVHGSCRFYPSRPIKTCFFRATDDLGVMPLSSPEVQQTIGGNTVHEIACHYGFQSRNHFARDYRSQFGESPSVTLQRVSAPGMSVQSVSVAQSPQMAMALR